MKAGPNMQTRWPSQQRQLQQWQIGREQERRLFVHRLGSLLSGINVGMKCCSDDTYLFTSIPMEASTIVFSAFLFVAFLVFICRIFWVVFAKRNEACLQREEPAKSLIVVGSGGHTSEILRLATGLSINFTPKVYVLAETDKGSEHKVLEVEEELNRKFDGKSKFAIRRIPRSREVGQSYVTSVISTLISSLASFRLVMQERPDLILCNGPGTCVPICLAGFLMKVFLVKDIKIVYVESICRVKTLSLSAKILYYFVDRLIVQWPELHEKYRRTVYLGRIM